MCWFSSSLRSVFFFLGSSSWFLLPVIFLNAVVVLYCDAWPVTWLTGYKRWPKKTINYYTFVIKNKFNPFLNHITTRTGHQIFWFTGQSPFRSSLHNTHATATITTLYVSPVAYLADILSFIIGMRLSQSRFTMIASQDLTSSSMLSLTSISVMAPTYSIVVRGITKKKTLPL